MRRRVPSLSLSGPLAIATVLLTVLVGLCAWAEQLGWLYVWFPSLAPPALTADGSGSLLKIRDGDTVEVRYHDLLLPVRLRNIDTAESVHRDAKRNSAFGAQTSRWAKQYLADVPVRVEFARKGWRIDSDHYGRALGYLWLDRPPLGPGPEDELYNETVIRLGYSRYVTSYGNGGPYHQRFVAAQAEAQAAGRGLWHNGD